MRDRDRGSRSSAPFIYPRFKTTYLSPALTGSLVAFAAGFVDISTLGQLTSMGPLLALVIVCAGVLIRMTSSKW